MPEAPPITYVNPSTRFTIPTRRPEIVIAYANTLNLEGRRRRESADLLQRTRERLGPQDAALDERLTALLVIACQFEPELYPIATAQIREYADRGAEATGLMLVIGAIDAARHGDSRARAIDLGRRAIASDLIRTEDRLNLVSACAALAMADDVERAEHDFAHVIAVAQRRGDRLAAASSSVVERACALREAVSCCSPRKTSRSSNRRRWGSFRLQPRTARASTPMCCSNGARPTMPRRCSPESPSTICRLGHHIQFLYARGRVRLQQRDREGALADFLQAGSSAESVEIHNPAYVPVALTGSARAAAARTDRRGTSARAARNSHSRDAGARRARSASRCVRSASSRADKPASSCCARRSRCSRTRLPGSSTRALSSIWARCSGAATAAARRGSFCARESSSRIGAARPPWSQRANDELAATGAHRRTILLSGLDALTASERRVAQMAAEELSNKEIAQALFVTVKTVEQHLGRVYRKLDISSRRQLGAALGGPAEAAPPA